MNKAFILSLLFLGFVSTNGETIQLEDKNLVALRGPIYKETSNKFFQDLKDFKGNSLNIFISSPGGSVMEGMKMIDYIETLKNDNVEVNCIADFAASMAFVILQSCSNRYTLNSGVLMQHQMSLGVDGPLENLNNYLAMIEDINLNLNHNQADRIGMTPDNFSQKVMNDWWISGFSAKKYNVVDDNIMVTCDNNLYDKKSKLELASFFGNVELTFSKCPLVRNPLKVRFKNSDDSNHDNNHNINNIIDMYDPSSYLQKKLKIKEWL